MLGAAGASGWGCGWGEVGGPLRGGEMELGDGEVEGCLVWGGVFFVSMVVWFLLDVGALALPRVQVSLL